MKVQLFNMDVQDGDFVTRLLPHLRGREIRYEPSDAEIGAGGAANLFVLYWTRAIHVRPTSHRRVQINIVLRGAFTMAIDDKLLRIGPGEAVLAPSFAFHHYGQFESQGGADGLAWIAVYFDGGDPELLSKLGGRVIPLSVEAGRRLEKLVFSVHGSVGGGAAELDESPAWLTLLLIELARTAPAGPMLNLSAHSVVMQKVVRYIGAHLAEPLSLDRLAGEVDMSESSLRRLALETLGMGLGEYVRRNRLTRAAALLQSTHLRVGEVAESCGFSSIYAFSRAFRIENNCSPAQFRRRAGPAKNRGGGKLG